MNPFTLLANWYKKKSRDSNNGEVSRLIRKSVNYHNSFLEEYTKASDDRKKEIEKIWLLEELYREELKKKLE